MLGQRIKEARTALDLSQEALAKGICSRSYISGLESGKIRPSAENLQHIAHRLDKPLSYFLPDERGVLVQRVETLLNQAKVHLAADDVTQAQALFKECQSMYDRSLPQVTVGLYYDALAELQRKSGAVLESAVSAITAADAYLTAGHLQKAWDCKYSAAFGLHRVGHMDYAISLALDALKLIADELEFVEQLRRTHYLLGCCYAALGNTVGAQRHFTLAEKDAGHEATEMSIKGLIARASCYGRQGDWGAALEFSQKAAALSERSKFDKLKAEALIGACVCMANMQETTKVGELLAEVVGIPGIEVRLKRKAYREVTLALSEAALTEACRPYEFELERLLRDLDPATRDWEAVKDEWALAKCSLLREPQGVMERALSFSQQFVSLMRHRDASDVLVFGADLLRQQNQTQDAYGLLKAACDLLKSSPRA